MGGTAKPRTRMSQATVSTGLTAGFTEQTLRALIDARQEPDWIVRRRRQAWTAFAETPMPSMNHEEWRRTNIRTLKLDVFMPAGFDGASASPAAPESFAPHLSRGQFAGSMLQVDGQHASVELAQEFAKKGVIFCSMD